MILNYSVKIISEFMGFLNLNENLNQEEVINSSSFEIKKKKKRRRAIKTNDLKPENRFLSHFSRKRVKIWMTAKNVLYIQWTSCKVKNNSQSFSFFFFSSLFFSIVSVD